MEPIAIVGLSFKLPQGVGDESSFWDLLEKGRNVMTAWPKSRANVDGFFQTCSSRNNTLPSTGAHFLAEDPTAFDAPFFSISSKEAASMDPQQRMLLETTYHALENAGIPVEDIVRTETGVFSGSMESDYHRIISKDPDEAPTHTATGVSVSILANRLSWYFDLKGPSLQLNTACSSSLIAMDLACQSLRRGESSMALVTGSNLMLTPELSLYMANLNMLSPDGLCYSFDHRANGYSRAEGVIVLVLKTLSTAIRDGDNIRAVVRETGSNQDGRTPGITQPSSTSQESLIRQVYSRCDVGFESTRYVEAHGTGTQLGDANEMKAIGAVFKGARSSKGPIYVGSVKSNVGHLEGGSGLAGVLKCILILEKGVIPPNALLEKLNPKINAKRNNIQVPTSCIPWPTGGLRRASINSFGFGGSNAHAIMDDAYHTLEALTSKTVLHLLNSSLPTRPAESNGNTEDGVTRPNHTGVNGTLLRDESPNMTNGRQDFNCTTTTTVPGLTSNPGSLLNPTNGVGPIDPPIADCIYQLLVYSARDVAALERVLQQYGKYYDDCILGSPERLKRLAYTLAARRSKMALRAFAVGNTGLSSEAIGLANSDCVRSSLETQVCFVFTGQGAQYSKMGLELIRYPVFLSTLSKANRVFQDIGADWSLLDKIESGEGIDLPQFSQPLCTALQIALFELLKSFNISPVAVLGHSSGEIAAAYAVGALSLQWACKIAYHRGRLSGHLARSAEPRAMMSVNLEEGSFSAYVDKIMPGADIHIACVNSPSNITVAGLEVSIDVLKRHLDDDAVFSQKLKTGLAYHTHVMRQIASEYLSCMDFLGDPILDNNTTLMVSSVTGQKVTPAELSTGQYWVDNLTSQVRFADALQYIAQAAPKLDGIKAISDYVEIGPHGALRRPILETLSQVSSKREAKYVSVLSRLESPLKTTLELAGRLFTRGHPVSITAVNQQDPGMNAPPVLTDAPEYPFDHSQKYWYEGRLSRDWRLRGAAPREVLGIRSTGWNPLQPTWRKMLSLEEAPWIADHVVDGATVFPAAGSLVMALEAVKQTVDAQKLVSGYLVKEATFSSPIFIRPECKTEVLTQLRSIQDAYERTSLRFEVVIFSVDEDGNWAECSKVMIHAQVDEGALNEVDGGQEERASAQAFVRDYEVAKLSCVHQVTKQAFYTCLDKQGLSYGDSFALAEDIFWDGHELCLARVDNIAEPYEGVFHPVVFDNCLQACSTAPSGGMSKTLSTFIPHRLRDTWISATGWQRPHTHSIRIQTRSRINTSSTGLECSFTVLSDDGTLLCHAKKVGMSAVANNVSTSDNQKQLVHSIDWKPQLSLLSPVQLHEFCDAESFTDDEAFAIDYCVRLEAALRTSLERQLSHLKEAAGPETPEHLRRFVSWAERQLCKRGGVAREKLTDELLKEELENLRAIRPAWRMFIDVAQALPSIVRGETDTLDLLFTNSLAQDFYDDGFQHACNHKLFSYLELATHQNPSQRILEVGAGTGGMTNEVLRMLHGIEQRTGGTSFSEYLYTDVTPAYFEEARVRFGDYSDRMIFKTLDLDRDISDIVEPGTCDIILAGSVLHATKNLSDTLRNLRRALKPGGKLIMIEITAPDCFLMSFGFGILPAWWCGEEESRKWCPTITEPEWDALLRNNGFCGNDLVIRGYKDERAQQISTIISSTDTPTYTDVEGTRIWIVVDDQDHNQQSLASALEHEVFNSSSYRPRVLALSRMVDVEVLPTDIVIFLADMGGSILAEPSDEMFRRVQIVLQKSKQLLWVTASTVAQNTYPYTGLKDGLLRVVRSENDSKKVISLSLEDSTSDGPGHLQHIAQVFRASFESLSSDSEYIVRHGKILSGRLINEIDLNHDLLSSIYPQTKYEAWLPGPPLKFDVGVRGSLDSLRFVEDDSCTELGPTEIEIEVQSWAIGFRDVFGALGRLDENEFGTDCAGVVTRAGSQCTELRPGTRVCTSSFGCMRTFVRCSESDAFEIADSLSVEEACGAINPAMTAWYSLVNVANLKEGDKILIHAASGATGQAAIQVAKMIGAEIFATVGYDHKKQLLIDDYGIPASHIFYSRDLSFSQGIMRVTNGYGVDVVLNSLVGEGLRASWECVAPYGKFIEIGKADIYANTPLPMACFANNVTFSAVDLRHLTFHRVDAARELFHTVMRLVREGAIHCPRPWHTFSVSHIEEAFRYFQSGKNTGRVIVRVEHSAKVQKHLVHHKTWNFDGNATYVVAAGLGGVGRSILQWMASRGAKHLIVPSRSGAASKAATEVVNKLTAMGVKVVTPRCDLSVTTSLQKVLEDHAEPTRPIRGCINASMVLNDSVFDNITRAQWESTIRSKVQSSWNLHNLLPKGLDFFILLSSASGVVGNAGQSNYAAGCTFQDSLCRFRECHGQRAVSIDLGPMRTVGTLAEKEDLKNNFAKLPGLNLIEEEELLALLDILCHPKKNSHILTTRSQITMGIATPADLVLQSDDMPLEHLHRSLFAYFGQSKSTTSNSVSANSVSPAALFRQAENTEEMTRIVVDSLVMKLARAVSIQADDVVVDRPLHLYGVDSLVAVELRNWIIKEFSADVPVFELLSGKTVLGIGQLVVKTSQIKRT